MRDKIDALLRAHDPDRLDAITRHESAFEGNPEDPTARRDLAGALNDAGALLRHRGKPDEAIACYRRALALQPDQAGFSYNLGNALADVGRVDEAVASYREALRLKPGFVDAHLHLGDQLRKLRRLDDAIRCYAEALRIDPSHVGAHCNLAIALAGQRRFDRAVAHYERAIAIRPDHIPALYNLANLLVQMERREAAIAHFARVLELRPEFAAARAKMLHQQALIGDWDAIAAGRGTIARLGVEGEVVTPFSMLALEDEPARHRIRSERFVAKRHPPIEPAPFTRPAVRPERLRIGYFSADFHSHATMNLMARLFELHDRSRFETFAFAHQLDADDAVRARLIPAFDSFRDVKHLGDRAIVDLARAEAIDIAIDLTGHTSRNRLGIFALRAAPIQISYLGYPGTMGAPFFDYMIADRHLIPPEQRAYYSEKIIYLPHQYQAQDDHPPLPAHMPSRAELGLPDRSFVFCAINNSYKIGPAEFAIWMRLLKQVEDSVLWMLRSDAVFERNMLCRAAVEGVDPARIIFCDRSGLADYLAKLTLADLFLDSFTYNAGATASHALWAGLPVLTRTGSGYTARMAGSLLHAIGLPELITASDRDYEAIALALATQPERLARIRTKLGANRATEPLFDTDLFTHHIELSYQHAYQRYFEGLAPDDIDVVDRRTAR